MNLHTKNKQNWQTELLVPSFFAQFSAKILNIQNFFRKKWRQLCLLGPLTGISDLKTTDTIFVYLATG